MKDITVEKKTPSKRQATLIALAALFALTLAGRWTMRSQASDISDADFSYHVTSADGGVQLGARLSQEAVLRGGGDLESLREVLGQLFAAVRAARELHAPLLLDHRLAALVAPDEHEHAADEEEDAAHTRELSHAR